MIERDYFVISRETVGHSMLDGHLAWLRELAVALLFAVCAVVVILNQEVIAAVIMLLVWGVMIALTDDLMLCLTPVLLLSVFVTSLYDSFDTFIKFWWVAIPVAVGVAIHLVRFKKHPKIGASFFGLCAVSAALILGGMGKIPAADYFKPMTLFYVISLGVGMLALYLVFQPAVSRDNGGDLLLRSIYIMGLFALFCVLRIYAENWQTVVETHKYLEFQSRNNLSTMLMIALPIPCYYASKRRIHIVSFFALYFALLLANSRGGVVFGTVEFILCMLLFAIFDKKNRYLYIFTGIALVIFTVVFNEKIFLFLLKRDIFVGDSPTDFSFKQVLEKYLHVFVKKDEPRLKMLLRLDEEIKDSFIFGHGIGYQGNSDIYTPKKGAMNWYHMWFPQIIGSMGIVGVFAYFYNLFVRIKLLFKKKTFFALTVGMSYCGLFLMSQVNPGEFCPVPYSMLAVLLFISVEDYSKKSFKLFDRVKLKKK